MQHTADTGAATRRGRDLERVVAGLFTAHGYRVETNVLMTGRSGARHEVDVLARTADGLVESVVGVECKHWVDPVGLDVVARARMLREDLGLSVVVVACPGGAGPAARTAAQEHGVTLWDADALRERLGSAALAALDRGTPREPAVGLERTVAGDVAAELLRARARGPLGALREHIAWVADAWLPVHELRLDCAREAGRRARVEAGRLWNAYEAVTGSAVATAGGPLQTVAVDLAGAGLPALVAAKDVTARITRAFERSRSLTQASARARHAAVLEAAMIPPDLTDLGVADARTLAWPVTVALLRRGDVVRLAVLDGHTGRQDRALGEVLTTRVTAVAAALGRELPGP